MRTQVIEVEVIDVRHIMRFVEIGAATLTALALVGWSTESMAQPASAPPASAPGASSQAGSSNGATLSLGAGGSTDPNAAPQDKGATDDSKKDEAEEEKKPLPWRGTTFTIDQSATTQTVGLGEDYLSSNPLYELDFLFSPRYRLLDAKKHTISVSARFEASKELTNSDSTTEERELLFGNTRLSGTYTYHLYQNKHGVVSLVSLGARVGLPTSKASWMSGERLRVGGVFGLRQAFPIAGVSSDWFPSGGLMGRVMYDKPLRDSTTGENPNFKRTRQDAGGRTFISSQISTGAKVEHQLTALAAAQVDLTQKLHLSASYVWIMQWTYKFSDDEQVQTAVGTATAGRLPDTQNYRVIPWASTSLDYDLLPEIGLSLGYYNASNQIGPDGQRRNPLWSPDARVFFDITANLDEIYRSVSGRGVNNERQKQEERRSARVRRMQGFSSL